MKRFLLGIAALFLITCTAFSMGKDEKTTTSGVRLVYPVKVFYEFSKDRLPTEYPYFAKLAEDKFGLQFVYEYVPAGSTVEKTNLLFAAGSYYDMHPYGLRTWDINRWAMEGYIVPLSDYMERLPNYRKWWSDQDWETMLAFSSAPDGKLYLLPSKNSRTISRAWVYRKDLLDSLGLEWPETIDGYRKLLSALKDAYPGHYPLFTRGAGGIFTDVFENTWRTSAGVHFDVDTGDLVYGETTDKYRRMIQFLTGLYRDGLVDPEYITNTRVRENEILYVRNTAITTPNWVGNVPYMNNMSRQNDPGVEWTYSYATLLEYDAQPMMVSLEDTYWPWGPFLTNAVQGEKLQRLIEYLDWIVNDDGLTARYFGEEGVTFEYRNGTPVFMEHMRTPDNPLGEEMWKYGLENYPILHPDRPKTAGDIIYDQMTEWAVGKDSIRKIPWPLDKTEEQYQADVHIVVRDTRDRFLHQFVLGDLDPDSDDDWQLYLTEMKKAGVDSLIAIYQKAYDRYNQR
jgi:putative aldouronate transport system substrate-binding protein